MSKFKSDWIERNTYLREKKNPDPNYPNYKQYEQYERPLIICLCGSTRFYEAYQIANYELTMRGHIVLTVGHYMHSVGQVHGQNTGCTPEQKAQLDELHKQKIDLADAIYVLNVGGYIGESTRSEIEHAKSRGKTIRYLEPIE